MPTPRPYIRMQRTEQGPVAFGGGPCDVDRIALKMVLACPYLALEVPNILHVHCAFYYIGGVPARAIVNPM